MNPGMLRIALVGPLPPASGGMANQTLQLAGLLREAGAHVELVQVNAPYRPACVARLKGVRALFRLLPFIVSLWRAAARADLFHVMANSGWSWHLFAAPAIRVAKLRRRRVVVNYRGGEADRFFAAEHASIAPTLRLADAIIVPSAFLKEVFGKYGHATSIVANIVDLARFKAAGDGARKDGDGGPCLLVARNLEPIYDNASAIRAFRRVKDDFHGARLVIAGTGPDLAALQELVRTLDLAGAVHFTGRVDNEAMAVLYRGADIVLNPSLVDNMPISILEALASGVPVVSTNVGGIPSMVTHGENAWLVPARDPAAMADAAIALLRDPARATRMREAGLVTVRQYAWPQVRAALFQVYAQALSGDGRRQADNPSIEDAR